jgi:Secretion system C-terminal sorting domain
MFKSVFLSAIMLIMAQVLYAQEIPFTECGTPPMTVEEAMKQPWFNNEKWFVNFQDSMNTLYRMADEKIKSDPNYNPELKTNSAYFLVPIKFWVYYPAIGNLEPWLVGDFAYQSVIDRLNAAFRNSNISVQFYLKCVERLADTQGAGDVTHTQQVLLGTQLRDAGAVNVHIVGRVPNYANGNYNPVCRAIFVRAINMQVGTNSTTIHEIGHYFGLVHTNEYHDIPCLKEPVTRDWIYDWCPSPLAIVSPFGWALPWQRCLTTGDFLCDTDAAPELLTSNESTNCIYTGNQTDYRGERYHPDLQNYMLTASLGAPGSCRSHFSPQQSTILTRGIDADYDMCAQTWCDQIDDYEPDNHQTTARAIKVGETQYHSFDSYSCTADDWIRIYKNPAPSEGMIGTHTLTIDEVAGRPFGVQTVEIYTASGGNNDPANMQLRSISITTVGNRRQIKIPCELLLKDNVFIRIAGTVNATNPSWYKASLTSDIPVLPTFTNTSSVCIGQPITLNNLPAGATVAWASNNGTLSAAAGNTTSISSFSSTDPNCVVTATVSLGGCNYVTNKTFTRQQSGELSIVDITDDEIFCRSKAYEYEAYTTGGAWTYNWSISPSNFQLTNIQYGVVRVKRATNGYFTLTLNATNSCGDNVVRTETTFYERPNINRCKIKGWVRLAPNPTNTYINLDLSDFDTNQNMYIRIIDQFGNVVYNAHAESLNFSIDVSTYKTGIYFLEVITVDGVESQSFIVN